jgi:hypothetical protein
MKDRSWNVYENKGRVWKTLGRSRDVFEKKEIRTDSGNVVEKKGSWYVVGGDEKQELGTGG